jgi:hypothetical protein
MALAPVPRIIYDAGLGAVTVAPTYANVTKPQLDSFEALRHDSISSAGVRQSIVERVDRIVSLMFESVPWGDLPMWENFFAYAITGGSFIYYPDDTATAYRTYELVDDKVVITFVCIGLSKFQLNLRQIPGGASSP